MCITTTVAGPETWADSSVAGFLGISCNLNNLVEIALKSFYLYGTD